MLKKPPVSEARCSTEARIWGAGQHSIVEVAVLYFVFFCRARSCVPLAAYKVSHDIEVFSDTLAKAVDPKRMQCCISIS